MRSSAFAWLGGLACVLLTGCETSMPSGLPTFGDDSELLDVPSPPPYALRPLEGVFSTSSEAERFDSVVVARATRATFSLFGAASGVVSVMRAGCLQGGRLVLEGFWRFGATHESGLIRLTVTPDEVAQAICAGLPLSAAQQRTLRLEGASGEGSHLPERYERFVFDRPLRQVRGSFFHVVAHKGACRTIDGCGAAENSLEAIRLAEPLGADAIEIDVRMTSDGVPILFHDPRLSERLSYGIYCRGRVENFSLADLRALCRLENGEQIPTLAEALEVAARETDLASVWLDIKDAAVMAKTAALIQERQAAWATLEPPRSLPIRLGLPDAAMREAYRQLPAPRPDCIAEGDLETLTGQELDCWGWGPRWTQDHNLVERASMLAAPPAIIFWTMDESDFIDRVLARDRPNGIITNRPGVVFHRFQLIGHDPARGPVGP